MIPSASSPADIGNPSLFPMNHHNIYQSIASNRKVNYYLHMFYYNDIEQVTNNARTELLIFNSKCVYGIDSVAA